MTAPALSLVPLDARPPQPEQLVLRPVIVFAVVEAPEPWEVAMDRRRPPRRKCASPAPRWEPVDLLDWRPRALRAPIRSRAMRVVLTDEIVLPRSGRKATIPRRMIGGESPESLGATRLTAREREEMRLEVELATAAGETFGPPDDDRDCPTGPCAAVGCRHNLYIEVSGKFTTLNFPGRHIDEIPDTCSLRVARKANERRDGAAGNEPAMSFPEIGQYLNLTPETVRGDLMSALRKLRVAGVRLK